ncbi:MAG: cytochrome-c peroxidase [Gallionella sp.]
MLRQWRWLMLALAGLALCGTVLFWYLNSIYSVRQGYTAPSNLVVGGREPITPIPLDLKLDARKVALGGRLFHDPQLSSDNTISCAHCHNLANGGMDSLPRPFGIGGQEGNINVPTVFNSGFNFRQFWNGRAASLEDQIDFPLNNPLEMDSNWGEVTGKLEHDENYRRDFAAIYPEGIQPSTVKDAIATFERSLITPNGKFDRFLRGEKEALDKEELAGYKLFKSLGCISCHQGRNVGGNMYEKLGLLKNYFEHRGNVQVMDYGRYNVTQIEEHRYEFRVPSLRNVALTAPYFHDASASTLEQAVAVMAEYQLGVNLSKDEIDKIVRFLNTLTGFYQGEASK